MRKFTLIMTALLAVVAAVGMPLAHATNNVHTFYLGNSAVGSCVGKCENLVTTTGSADTGTSQSIPLGVTGTPTDQTTGASAGTTATPTCTYSTNPTQNDVLVVSFMVAPSTITVNSVTDTLGNSFSLVKSLSETSTTVTFTAYIYSATEVFASGLDTITIHLSGTTTDTYLTCWEDSGITTTTGATASGSGTLTSGTGPFSMSSASMATTANDLIYAFAAYQPCVSENTSPTYTSGFTSMNAHGTPSTTGTHCANGGNNPANDNMLNEYEIPTTTGSSTAATQSGTFSQSISTNTWGWVELEVDFQASSAVGKYIVKPDVASSATTGTPSTSSVSGYAWVYNTDLGSATIDSGTWTFNVTTGLNSIAGGPVGNLWVTVWNCGTNSLTSCTFLFKNWNNNTNVLASTTPTKYSFTTGTVGPFSNIHFISVEYWISYTSGGSSPCCTVTETTVSSASAITTPDWQYTRNLPGSLTSVAGQTKGIGKALSSALGLVSTIAEKNSFLRTLFGALTQSLSVAEKSSFLRSLFGSISLTESETKGFPKLISSSLSLAASETKGIAKPLTNSLGLVASEVKGLAKSLTGSLACSSSEIKGLAKTFTASLTFAGSGTKGFTKFLSAMLSLAGSQTKGLAKSLAGSLSFLALETKGLAKALTSSLGLSSSFIEHISLFRILPGSLSLSESETKGLAKSLTGSLGLSSSFMDHVSLLRSLGGSLGLEFRSQGLVQE